MWMIETICIYQRLSGGSHRILALSKDVILFTCMSRGRTEIKKTITLIVLNKACPALSLK